MMIRLLKRSCFPLNFNFIKDTDKESYLNYLKTATPLEVLNDLYKRIELTPFQQDIDIVNKIQEKNELPFEVINVLLDYVFTKKGGQLPPRYIVKIADNWANMNLKTVEEAMAHAKWYETRYGYIK